jgi:hypothetical protein
MAGREYVSPSVPAANTMLGMGSSRFNSNGFGLSNGADAIGSNPNFLSPSTFSNTTPTEFGLQPNKSVPYHYSCKSFDDTRFSPGALMFAIKNPRRFNLSCPNESRRVEDLIELNAWLATLPETHRRQGAGAGLDTAQHVVREIKFLGVLKTKVSDSHRERHLGTYVANNVVGGRASVVNVWGNSAREGTPLYMIVKKVPKEYGQKWVWQLCPYANMQHDAPPLNELLYRDEAAGPEKLGTTIFIGTSMSTPTAFVEGNETLIESKNAERLSCYSGGVDVCVGV